MSPLYAKIFVGNERESVEAYLASALTAPRREHTISTEECEIDVRRNDDSDDRRYAPSYEGFIHAPVYPDVFGRSDVTPRAFIAALAQLVTALWSAGVVAVAATDFEDDLPHRGGVDLLKAGNDPV